MIWTLIDQYWSLSDMLSALLCFYRDHLTFSLFIGITCCFIYFIATFPSSPPLFFTLSCSLISFQFVTALSICHSVFSVSLCGIRLLFMFRSRSRHCSCNTHLLHTCIWWSVTTRNVLPVSLLSESPFFSHFLFVRLQSWFSDGKLF